MPSLSIRLDDDTFDKVKRKGGSPWVRDMLAAAIWGGEIAGVELDHGDPLEELRPVEEKLRLDEEEFRLANPALEEEPVVLTPTLTLGDEPCPRWMHHKPSELCLVCGHQS